MSKKIIGLKKKVCLKEFGFPKNLKSNKNLRSKNFLSPNKFLIQKMLSKKDYMSTKISVKRNGPKNFRSKKI